MFSFILFPIQELSNIGTSSAKSEINFNVLGTKGLRFNEHRLIKYLHPIERKVSRNIFSDFEIYKIIKQIVQQLTCYDVKKTNL